MTNGRMKLPNGHFAQPNHKILNINYLLINNFIKIAQNTYKMGIYSIFRVLKLQEDLVVILLFSYAI